MTDAETVCTRHGLHLGEVFRSQYGVVARVRDADGRDLLLKAAQTQQHDCMDEAAAFRAWRGRECVPQLVAVLDDGHHLREFVDGVELDRHADGGRSRARACGALLAALHDPVDDAARAAAPRSWIAVEGRVMSESIHLDATARARAARCVDEVARTTPAVLVHGDFYPRNIIDSAHGLKAVDPLARLDIAAADVATFAMTCPGELDGTLADLVEGYGSTPPALAAYVELWGIRNRHYRGAFEAALAHDPSLTWQPCYADAGDGVIWTT